MTNQYRQCSLVVDFGGTATKVLLYKGSALVGQACFDSEQHECSAAGLERIMREMDVDRPALSRIVATGGRSAGLPNVLRETPVAAVNEIEAVGAGGLDYLGTSADAAALVVSIGTGTAMAVSRRTESGFDVRHVGGLGLGGGTLMGLGKLVCQVQSFDELNALAVAGRTENIDLLVGDIVGSGIGMVPAELTASNFGKAARGGTGFSNADMAAGLFTLVGQSVARLAIVLARQAAVEQIVVIGQVTENAYMREVFANMQALFGGAFVFASESRYRVAIGAFQIACAMDAPVGRRA